MLFNTTWFVFGFLPAFLLFFIGLPRHLRKTVLLFFSIFFYAWGAPVFVFVLLASVVFDFFIAQRMALATPKSRKRWLALGVSTNLVVLFVFKYLGAICSGFVSLHSSALLQWANNALPIGVSFFTFHELSYLFDVYRERREPFSRWPDYALYIMMFPQLVSGPIIRFHQIAGQIEHGTADDEIGLRLVGFTRFVIGLAKKIFVADVLAGLVAPYFSESPVLPLGCAASWFIAGLNLLHIYIDFSAYSDMAIGLAAMIGFIFPENFNSPLTASSVTVFWKRWHMTLSTWLRDYLYIPIGGNRGTLWQTSANLFFVFLISGVWHGAAWKYVIWGALFGLFVAAERFVQLKMSWRLPKAPAVFYTLLLCCTVFVFFSSPNVTAAINYISGMFSSGGVGKPIFFNRQDLLAIAIALIIAFGTIVPGAAKWVKYLYKTNRSDLSWLMVMLPVFILFIGCAALLFIDGYHPFLYFKF